MGSLSEVYDQKIQFYKKELQKIQQRLNLVVILRLFSFLGLAMSIYYWAKEYKPSMLLTTVLAIIIFLYLVKVYFKLKDKKALNEKLLFINENEKKMLEGEPNQFDNGTGFINHENYFDDLDIFGPSSLYHLLNSTTTGHGSTELATLLGNPLLEKDKIIRQQDAIKNLSTDLESRQLMMAHGLLNQEKGGDLYSILEWTKTAAQMQKRKWLQIIRWVLPLFTLAAFIYYLSTDNYLMLSLGIIANWVITGIFAGYINKQHTMIGEKEKILKRYADILNIFSHTKPGDSVLLQELNTTAKEAHHSIGKLSLLSSFFDQRLNFVANVLLNSFVLYDIQCILELEKWKASNQKGFEKYIDTVGKIECLNSLASFAYNHPSYCYPIVSEGIQYIEAKQLAHPLIAEKETVANDFSIGKSERLQLVTGSNMSGKTTFLRTVGINLLLAQCGSAVCATQFSFSPMKILSSIRVSDSLMEHTSYFMAELKKLQQIILQLETGNPALVLVDEILRGTNSEDKTHGSEQFIRKLLNYNCLTLFATHDLSLGELSKELPNKVNNYCFESLIQNGELHFDFKLQQGIAKNKNASFLMQKMGII
jgi:DNA mismatch repair ATPase MutS